MFKAIGFVIKFFIFSALILVIGNWVSWDGKTLSGHVRSQLSHVERSDMGERVRTWTKQITDDARGGFDKKLRQHTSHGAKHVTVAQEEPTLSDQTKTESSAPVRTRSDEQIPASERQKLRALIQELNSSHGKD